MAEKRITYSFILSLLIALTLSSCRPEHKLWQNKLLQISMRFEKGYLLFYNKGILHPYLIRHRGPSQLTLTGPVCHDTIDISTAYHDEVLSLTLLRGHIEGLDSATDLYAADSIDDRRDWLQNDLDLTHLRGLWQWVGPGYMMDFDSLAVHKLYMPVEDDSGKFIAAPMQRVDIVDNNIFVTNKDCRRPWYMQVLYYDDTVMTCYSQAALYDMVTLRRVLVTNEQRLGLNDEISFSEKHYRSELPDRYEYINGKKSK